MSTPQGSGAKKCAICGESVASGLLACPNCGRGVFETDAAARPERPQMSVKARGFVEYRATHHDASGVKHALRLWEKLTQQERDEVHSGKVGRCDTCSKTIGEFDGYLLSTEEVVLSVSCWKRFLLNSQATIPNILSDDVAFVNLMALRASSDTPWQVCEECAGMLSFDRKRAKSELFRNRLTGEPSSGFALCTVSKRTVPKLGERVVIDTPDERLFNQVLKAAAKAREQLLPKD